MERLVVIMHDRGMIKWQPFDSVISSKRMVNQLSEEKNKMKRPELSEEQITTMENLLIESFTNQEEIIIYFYKGGKILHKSGFVTELNSVLNKVLLNDHSFLFFNQIVNIKKC